METLSEKFKNAVPQLIILGAVLFILIVINIVDKKTDSKICTINDLYEIGEWRDCSSSNIQTRKINKKEVSNCRLIESIDEPVSVRSCEYLPICKEEDLIIREWEKCKNGIQKRTITLKDPSFACENKNFKEEQNCQISIKKNVTLLKDYETLTNSDWRNPYEKNKNNITLTTKGKFKNAKLTVTSETIVQGGKIIRIPEYYYLMFAINDNVPRVLGARRVELNRLDLNSDGVFKGTDTPKTLSFDLKNLGMATRSHEDEQGMSIENILAKISSEKEREIKITLHMGDGQSMIEEDPAKRIFGVIKEAIIEYECEDNSDCFLEAGQSIEIKN